MRLILLAYFLRPLVRNPARFAVTVLGVACGVASVVATVASSRAAIAAFEEGVIEIAGESRLEITRAGGVDEDLLGALRSFSRDAKIMPVLEEIALLPQLGDSVRVLGVDTLVDQEARDFDLVDGEAASELSFELLGEVLRGRGVLLPVALARTLSLKVGDDLSILVRSETIQTPVVGIIAPRILGEAWSRVVVMDIGLAQEVFGRVGRVDRIEYVPRSGVALDVLARRLVDAVPSDYDVERPSQRGQKTRGMVRALEFNLTALSGISLLVGAVLVATTLATAVVQRRKTIAEILSLGASRFQICLMVVVEALSVGLLGGILGVVLGGVFATLALSSVRSTVAVVIAGAPASSIQISPALAGFGVLSGVLVSLMASVLPALEAVGTPLVQVFRAVESQEGVRRRHVRLLMVAAIFCGLAWGLSKLPSWNDLPLSALLGALCLLVALLVLSSTVLEGLAWVVSTLLSATRFPAVRLACAALVAGRRRAAWATGAVGVAVALAVSITTMVGSFRTTVVDWTEQSLKSDLWIRPLTAATGVAVGRISPEVVDIARETFGSSCVDPFYESQINYQGRPVWLGAGALSVVARRGGVPYLSGRDSKEVLEEAFLSHGAIVNEPFSNRFGIKAGDMLSLEVPGGVLERKVVDVFHDYSNDQGLIVIDYEDYLEVFPDSGPKDISLFLPPGADPLASREKLSGILAGHYAVEILPNQVLKDDVLRVFDRTFAITSALQMVSSLVAVIAVLTVLSALVSERRRELGVLRVLGASPRQVLTVVMGESALLGVASAILGLVFGLLVGWVLVTVVNLQSFGWTLRFLPPWAGIFTSLAFVMTACLIAGVLPARFALRVTPAVGLREG